MKELMMRSFFSIVSVFIAGAAQAHESLVPHTHPHGLSILPDVGTFGIAALVLALAVIAFAQFKGR
jgi:hypothetical protein